MTQSNQRAIRKAPPGSKPVERKQEQEARPAAKGEAHAETPTVKEARSALRGLLASIIDLQVPGHGDRQSDKVLNAIDNLIRARLAKAEGVIVEREVEIDLETLIGEQIKERCPTLNDIEQLADKFLARQLDAALARLKIPSFDDFAEIADARAQKLLDEATAPAKEKTNGKN